MVRACVCMKEEECHKLRNFISFRRVRQSRPESIINLNTQSKTFFLFFIQAQVLRSLQKNITRIVRHYCDDGVIVCTRNDSCRNFREHCTCMSLWAVLRAEKKKKRERFRYKITVCVFAKF